MGSLISCLAAGAAWCLCTATASLMNSCCGNDKASDVPPSATSGRKRSVLLLAIATVVALIFQYVVGPQVVRISINNYVTNAWTDGCTNQATEDLQERCVGNNGVYRATSSALVFFLLAAIAAVCKPTANREAWPAKYILFIFLVIGTCFIPNDPLFSDIYIQIARIGAVFFIIVEQVIILDLAYNWNEAWVEKSNRAETDRQSQQWLGAILFSCILLLIGSVIGIGLLYAYFLGCGTNAAFITLTLVMSFVVTITQLFSEEASLLSSSVVVSYGVYLCYTAVSKNPNGSCNPFLGQEDVLGIVLGIVITVISLGWTGWSYTAEKRIDGETSDLEENLVDEENQTNNPDTSNEERDVKGVVTNTGHRANNDEEPEAVEDKPKPVSWRINVVLAFISCWIAMTLTGWGSISTGGNAANPSVGRVSMWMIVSAQWLMYVLYTWTLVAPRLFPDRDFS